MKPRNIRTLRTLVLTILPQTRQNLPILKKGFLTMTVMVSDHINFAEP